MYVQSWSGDIVRRNEHSNEIWHIGLEVT